VGVREASADEARGRRARGSLLQLASAAGIVAGVSLGIASLFLYLDHGYSHTMLWLWLGGLAALTLSFWHRSRALPRIAVLDAGIAAGLVAAFSPLYLLALYRWPVQVNSDEIAVMEVAKSYASTPNVDPFGVSWYLTRPTMLFIGWGKLGNLLGGVDLLHMRLLHAVFGLLTVAASYLLFRLLLPRRWAIFATVLVGASHSLFMISRLAMRENTALLALVIALALLLAGLRHDHELATFLGGVVAGLGFYVYFPARAAFPIWLVFLVALGLFYRRRFALRKLLALGAVAAVGFVLAATPIVYAESQVPSSEPSGMRESLMVYSAARKQQKDWVFADSELEGYATNAKYGLGTFNNRVVDHAWIYENHGHGFVDPLTGVLLWLGVGVVGLAVLRRRRTDEGALLMLGGFIALWLSFALLVNKAPNYTRLLITLPFVAFLVTEAVRWLGERWRGVPRARNVLAGSILGLIVVSNLAIGWDFVQKGRRQGEPIGSTARYVASHRDNPGQRF
jgi:dolichyl-phosphate-mannose-protein mannosyltransferase